MERRRPSALGPATLLSILFLLFAAVPALASDQVTLSLFGPETFRRDTGAPAAVVRTFTVPAVEGTFILHVVNGDGATDNLASSAVIKVNGVTLVRPSDLSQQIATVDKPVTNMIRGSNTLEVEVRSIPSSYISVAINGTYLLGVTISDPVPGATVPSDRATVKGNWVGYTSDVGVAVNRVRAAITGNNFVAEDVPLQAGDNPLTATVTTFDGIKNSDSITVASLGVKPPLALWSNFTSGVPPVTVSFRPEVEGITPMEYRYDFDGDGTVDVVAPADNVVSFTYSAPGTYTARITAVDESGLEYTSTKTIVSQDRVAVDDLLSNRWHALSTSLQAQDIPAALVSLVPQSRAKYEAIFTPLASQLPTIFATASPPELILVKGNVAQYRVRTEQLWDGVVRTITYYLWFVKDGDGVWRIDRF